MKKSIINHLREYIIELEKVNVDYQIIHKKGSFTYDIVHNILENIWGNINEHTCIRIPNIGTNNTSDFILTTNKQNSIPCGRLLSYLKKELQFFKTIKDTKIKQRRNIHNFEKRIDKWVKGLEI